MTDDVIYIPFPRKLYDDIVRFSDGQVNAINLVEYGVTSWLEGSIDSGDEEWGERLEEIAEIYAPRVAEQLRKEEAEGWDRFHKENQPLVWKEVNIRAGSDVRMKYEGEYHYAKVKGGQIVNDEGAYSPSEWASKVAGGTSRNAWRDLSFREPLSKIWAPALLLREQAKQELQRRLSTPGDKTERAD